MNFINFSNDQLYMKIKQPSEIELLTVKGYNYNSAALKIQVWWRKWSTLKEIKRLKINLRKRDAIYIPNKMYQETNVIVPVKRKFSEIDQELETISEESEEGTEEEKVLETLTINLFNSIKSQYYDTINFLMSVLNKFKFW